jgi:hypothetical protein
MSKIPVGATIAHAYRFAFGNFLAILKSTWIAVALQAGMTIFLLQRMAGLMTALMARDPAAIGQIGPLMLIYPFIIVLFFVQVAAVTELALGIGQPARYFRFPLGKPVWRLFGAFILATLAIAVIAIAFIIGAVLLGFLLKAGGLSNGTKIAAGLLIMLLFLVGYSGLIYLTCRFYFLLAPVTIAEQGIRLGNAWRLTKGNFWRIFLILLAILLPIMVAEYAVIFAAIGLPPVLPKGTTPQALETFQQAKLAWNLAMFSAAQKYWYMTLPLFGALMVIWMGTSCGAQVFAYRALTDDSAEISRDRLPDRQ